MVTVTALLAVTLPLDGVKVTPLPRVVLADQFTVPCVLSLTVHWYVLPVAEQLLLL